MKTTIPTLETVEDVRAFFGQLAANDELFHPEDDAADIVKTGSGAPLFTAQEAEQMNRAMFEVYEICDHAGIDPCAVALEYLNPPPATESGSASILIDLSDGNITVFHGTDHVVLHTVEQAAAGSWDAIWDTLKSLKSTK